MNGNYGGYSPIGMAITSKNDVYYCGLQGKVCKYASIYGQCSMSACINHEPQKTINGFADFLKDYARQAKENGYDGIGEIDIDEKLKEYMQL